MFGNGSQSPSTRCALPGLGIEATEAQIPGLRTMPFPLPTAAVATDQLQAALETATSVSQQRGCCSVWRSVGGLSRPHRETSLLCGHGAPDTSRPGGSTSYPSLRHAFLFYLNRQKSVSVACDQEPGLRKSHAGLGARNQTERNGLACWPVWG